jgi:hypothetical protein
MNLNVTTITVADPELLAKLAAADGQIIFRSPTGDTVKTAEVVANGTPPRVKSPISDEEFEEARKQTGGRSLTEILRDLEQKYGGR